MVFMLPIWFTPHVAGLSCGYAILKGRTEERAVAVSRMSLLGLSVASYGFAGAHMTQSDLLESAYVRSLLVQAVELAVALVVALRSNRRWTLFYAATVLVSVMTSCIQLIAPVSLWAYGTGIFIWDYLEDLTLVVGAARLHRLDPPTGESRRAKQLQAA